MSINPYLPASLAQLKKGDSIFFKRKLKIHWNDRGENLVGDPAELTGLAMRSKSILKTKIIKRNDHGMPQVLLGIECY